ncbi:MAG: hypothetical protein CMF23_15945 [Ignavibacteriae bacterium]|jgi:excisionase family DNA binding protein|nr:hypothetical protein [Ignavibacteriota bacterium]MDD3558274.1 helix-turn-helix domain-containing protein [Melioribacteraceae bacterium]
MENKLAVIEIDQLYILIKKAVSEIVSEMVRPEQTKDLLNFKETCEYLGIHPSTLNKWKAENKIPFKRLGKRIFFERLEILNSLKDSDYNKFKKLTYD